MTNLNYKASNIAKAERAHNKNFFEVMTQMTKTPSVSDLMFIVEAGGGTEEDFDAMFAKGFENLLLEVMEGINEAGFLGVKLDTKGLREKVQKELAEISPNTGEATNE